MTKHQKLAQSLIQNGKTKSWSEYGQEFGLSAEAARAVWKKVRKGQEVMKEIAKRQLRADFFQEEVIKQNYIADL